MPHIHEKIDWTVEVFIVHKNKVLLRLHDKYNKLLGVGGHIELDEDPLTAAKRECLEEVGLNVKIYGEEALEYHEDDQSSDLPTPMALNIHPISATHRHIGIVYYGTADSDKIKPEKPTDKWVWLTKEEIIEKEDILVKIKDYALGALSALGK